VTHIGALRPLTTNIMPRRDFLFAKPAPRMAIDCLLVEARAKVAAAGSVQPSLTGSKT
jgi:hypothetical protein